MTRFNRFCVAGLALGAVLLGGVFFGGRTHADIVNGSFEVGMSDWTTVGPNSAVPNGTINGFNATDGQLYAYLNTGQGAQIVLIQDFVLSAVAGLPAGYVSSNFSGATEGATLFQQFNIGSNNALHFDWNFLTNESASGGSNNDFAFAHLFSGASLVGSAYVDTFASLAAGGPNYALETGWQSVSFTGLSPNANYTLVFGVFDRGPHTHGDSALLVDNIRAVPEPSSILLVGLASCLGLVRRRNAINV